MLQHVETLLPIAGEIQAELNSHSVVAVRYPDLCKFMHSRWELGSFASGGISRKLPGYQFIRGDTNAKINGLVADLETLVSQVLSPNSPTTQALRMAL